MSEFDQLNHITCFSDKESLFVSEVTNKLDSGKANIVVPYGCNRYEILLEIIKKIGRKCLIVSAYSFLKNELADSFSAFFCERRTGRFSGIFAANVVEKRIRMQKFVTRECNFYLKY